MNKKKNNIFLLLLIFSVTLLWMFVFQGIKHLILPDISLTGSRLYTNIYSALFAVLVAWFIIKYRDKLNRKMNKEIESQQVLEKERDKALSLLDATLESTENRIKLFEHTIESINEIVNIADFNDRMIYVNRACCNAYGYTVKELLGKGSTIFASDKNPPNTAEAIRLATIDHGWKGELINRRKDGSEFPIYLSTSVIKDSNKQPVALVGVAHDITDRKKKEKLNNVLYRISQTVHVTENMDELYGKIHEVLGELIPVNNFYIALYDQQTDMISFPYFIDEEDEKAPSRKPCKGLTEYVMRTGNAQLIYEDQFNILVAKGEVELVGNPSPVWLGIPLKVLSATIGVMVVQDYKNPGTYGENEKEILTFVSEQIASAIDKKRTEDKLINYTNELNLVNNRLSQSEKMLKEMNDSKDKFFSIISHDLKGPYQGLLSVLDLLVSDYDSLTDIEKKNIFSKVQENSKRTYNLLETLLQWAQMQMGKVEFKRNNFNLWTIVSGTIDLLFESAYLKKIKLINSIDDKIDLYADQNMINLVLRNLIANAIKFSKPGGDIIVSSTEDEEYFVISVKDFGVGIKEKMIDNLFRIDVHTSTMGTAKEKGSGLGLLLCKDMVNMHNGKIWVESVEGEGSKFSFSIPKVESRKGKGES